MTEASEDWRTPLIDALTAHEWRGAFVLALPEYRPDLVLTVASLDGLRHFDFRAARMAPLGAAAAQLRPDTLDAEIDAQTASGGVVMQNAEALLALCSAAQRRAWFTNFLVRPLPAPAIAPVVLFADDAPPAHPRVVRPDPALLPEDSLLMRMVLEG